MKVAHEIGTDQPADRRRQADREIAAFGVGAGTHLIGRFADHSRDHLRVLEEPRTCGRQANAASVPGKQRNADFFLELRDLAAQRGLRDIQLRRRAAEAAGAGDVNETAQFSNVHVGLELCRLSIEIHVHKVFVKEVARFYAAVR